jgi:hypothetical protein
VSADTGLDHGDAAEKRDRTPGGVVGFHVVLLGGCPAEYEARYDEQVAVV